MQASTSTFQFTALTTGQPPGRSTAELEDAATHCLSATERQMLMRLLQKIYL